MHKDLVYRYDRSSAAAADRRYSENDLPPPTYRRLTDTGLGGAQGHSRTHARIMECVWSAE